MTCPFCGFSGNRPELHAHLTDVHHGKVETVTTLTGRSYYQLTCPNCGESWRQEIKPRSHLSGFLEEYAREIRLVAFDQFIYHLQAAHEREDADA